MFKKALQVATAFAFLLACYVGYGHVFVIVTERIAGHRESYRIGTSQPRASQQEAMALAERAFGREHWTAGQDLQMRYYNKERGYWMYARDYKRLKDGRQLVFEPFAVIIKSSDGRVLKTVVSQKAIFDLDKPFGLTNSGAIQLKHAQIEGDVNIRDDKGTPGDPTDDLRIGPMPYLEYDEPTLRIRSESDVMIQDRDMWINGFGLLITLRPKDEANPASGSFNPKSAFLRKNVHIIMSDVGKSGMMPGTARPDQQQGTKTPLDLRCAGEMQVDLPKPRLPVKVGPPAPPLPTHAMFTRDVVVKRGRVGAVPDQLNSDVLKLVLLPTPRPPARDPAAGPAPDAPALKTDAPALKTEAAEPAPGGSLSALSLHTAEANGHAVWLRSESQGMKALGNQLLYYKLAPDAPDRTFFMGDGTNKLRVEKIDYYTTGPNRGKVQSVTTIWSVNATVYDNGQGSGNSSVIAQGPGVLETRPERDKPVERKAIWEDQLEMVTVPGPGPDKQPRKKITLTGRPWIIDPRQGTLDARDRIVAWLKPKARPEPAPAAAPGAEVVQASTSESFEIEQMYALEDVHLNAPGRTMTARNRLDVEFDLLSQPANAKADGVPVAPVPATSPAPAPVDPNVPNADGELQTPVNPPSEPNISVKANRVWAKILQKSGQGLVVASTEPAGTNKNQIQEVRLRGAVTFHQDPAAGKTRGTDVTGEALDMLSLGEGKSLFKVFHQDPNVPKARNPLLPLARVDTDDFSIEGPVIGLDQKVDKAWVNGRGSLTQMAQRDLLSDKGLDKSEALPGKTRGAPEPATKRTPLKIYWKTAMKFDGQPSGPDVQQVAHAEFYGDVRAEMEDALLICQEMWTFMDRTVKLANPPRDDKEKDASRDHADAADGAAREAEPRAQIAWIECFGKKVGNEFRKVVAVSRKLDPETRRILLQQQQIEGDELTYDKLTGHFHVPGAGLVYLYNRDGNEGANPAGGPSTTASRPTVRPTAAPNAPAGNTRRATAVVGRNSSGAPGAEPPKGAAPAKPGKPLPPLKLTQVTFSQDMKGRFGTGKDSDSTETRWADFFGDVQVLHGKVASERETFDYDRPPADAVFLTSQTVRVVSEPSTNAPKGTARNFLTAWDNAQAITGDKTIQADKITYDSLTELFYAYAYDGRKVHIFQQGQIGQPYTTAGGRAVRYNHKTGESELIQPDAAIQLIDAKTGGRPGPVKPVDPKDTSKPTRVPFRRPGRSTTERKGFNGR